MDISKPKYIDNAGVKDWNVHESEYRVFDKPDYERGLKRLWLDRELLSRDGKRYRI